MVAEMTPRDTFHLLFAKVHSVSPRVELRRLPTLVPGGCMVKMHVADMLYPFKLVRHALDVANFTL